MFKTLVLASLGILATTTRAENSIEYVIGSDDFPESLDYMLDSSAFTDPQNFFHRMSEFRADSVQRNQDILDFNRDEDDKIIMFGENFTIHTDADKKLDGPIVQGYQNMKCSI